MILCCGEALIDMVPIPTEAGETAFVPHVGGAVLNTAVAIGRLGIASGMVTAISSDPFGQQIEAQLSQSHVDTSTCIRTDRLTTLAIVNLSGGQARYSFYDDNSAFRMIRPLDLPPVPDSLTAAFFGGISLCAEPAADTMEEMAGRMADRAPVMIDPNIRPGFIADETAYRARLDRMIGLADIVKLSDEDLDWLDPDDTGGRDGKIDRLLARGASIVLITLGAQGAIARHANGAAADVAARTVAIADTIGAGDTFNAGVLANLSERSRLSRPAIATLSSDDLRLMLDFANVVSSVTVSRTGANPPWKDELNR